ncbi:MAG: hypothetical protein AABX52_02265 [Nanoarchaeota archaeon]
MNQKKIALGLLTLAIGIVFALTSSADVEKLLQPGEVQTVYDGLRGNPAAIHLPQGGVSYQLRYQQRFLPKDLTDSEYATGTLDLYGKKMTAGPSAFRGSAGTSFGFPPAQVRAAPRLGVIQHSTQKGVQSELGVGKKQARLNRIKLTESPKEGKNVCCDRRVLLANNAFKLGKCDLDMLRKMGDADYRNIVKSACGSHPGYRVGPCLTTSEIACTAPAELP